MKPRVAGKGEGSGWAPCVGDKEGLEVEVRVGPVCG